MIPNFPLFIVYPFLALNLIERGVTVIALFLLLPAFPSLVACAHW